MRIFKIKTHLIIAVIITIIIIFSLNIVFAPTKKQVKAENGVLDLTNWNFEKDGVAALDGQWEFYWNNLLTYNDFYSGSNNNKEYVKVPSVWNKYSIDGKMLPEDGYATYRLKVRTNDSNSLKGLKILSMSTAYKLMINDELIAENGVVGKDKLSTISEFTPKTVSFKNTSKDFDIIIQVSNYEYSRGGVWHSIYIGKDQQIRVMKQKIDTQGIFIVGALIMIGAYHIAIFALQKRNKSALYFAVGIFIIAIRIPVTGEYFISYFIPNLSINLLVFIEYMTMYCGVMVWTVFVQDLYPEESSKKVIRDIIIIGILCCLFTILAPMKVYTRYLIVYEVLLASALIYTLLVILIAAIRKKEDAILLFIGSANVVFVCITDTLYQWNTIHSMYGGRFGYAAFILTFIQAYILAEKFSKSFDEVEALSNKLISLNKLKDEFLANTSHELRTPLNGIIGITESLIQGAEGELNEKQKQNLDIVVSSGRRLSNLINDILDVSRLKNKDIKIYPKNIALDNCVKPVIKLFKHAYATKPIEFICKIPEKFPYIYADEDRFIQILFNILGNAVKFTESGYISVSAEEKNNEIEIVIEDTGIGIPKSKIKDIWNSFEQVDASITRKYGGVGLGLYITKYLIELQGGKIWVESEQGRGSKFIFTLPMCYENSCENIEITDIQNLTQRIQINNNVEYVCEQNGDEVLVVDDDNTNLQVIFNILKLEGYSVTAVSNPIKAINILKNKHNISLVILDVMMPEVSGYEICQRIREKWTSFELPVIMLTAKNQQADVVLGFKFGANDFLPKPFETEELKSRVKTLIELKKSVDKELNMEIAFLQAQIKPHFLYNTLNTIAYFCSEDAEKAEELIENLSIYLRNSFDFSNLENFVPMEKEMKLVEAYIKIEKARFGERLKVEFEICDDDHIEIPPLILQPLVENAIKHGIMKRTKGGTIIINVLKEKEGILFVVTDDGVGMNEEKVKSLLSNTESKSVGLRNINKRLKKIYGTSLDIYSQKDVGTKISFCIPSEALVEN